MCLVSITGMEGHEKEKAKRPDVAERLRNRKTLVETVVKAALPGRLAPSWNVESRQCLRDELDRWIVSTSQVTHRLSLIFNRLLLYCIRMEDEYERERISQEDRVHSLPVKFEDSHFTGMALAGMKATLKNGKDNFAKTIEMFVEEEFGKDNYPELHRQRGDCQAIVIAARRYKTNFINSCVTRFFDHQKAYISMWCELNDIDMKESNECRDIMWSINGWKFRKYTPTFSAHVQEFIARERELLGNPNNMTSFQIKKSIPMVVRYFYHILECYTKWGQGKKFTLAPLCKIKCHYLTIDNTVLREILMNVKMAGHLPEDVHPFLQDRLVRDTTIWKQVFNYDGLRRRQQFGHQVDTDGVSVCFHFNRTIKSQRKANRRRCQKTKTGERVIAIDPGRSNLIYAYDTQYGEYHRLSRQQYYRDAGMKNRIRRECLRHIKLQGVYQSMSKSPAKSMSDLDWYQYQQVIVRNYTRLWTGHTLLSSRREALRVYSLKQRCLDKFFNRFVKDGEKPIVAYGAASINPTGKGELSVPVKYVYNKCKQRFHTIKENEEYSTKMHHACQQATVPIRRKESGATIRGLRWCSTCRKLVSRDKNACHNIAASFMAASRPTYLCRTTHIHAARLPARFMSQRGRPTHRDARKSSYNRDEERILVRCLLQDQARNLDFRRKDRVGWLLKVAARETEQPFSETI